MNGWLRAPKTVVTWLPASFRALDCNSKGAIMTLPPTQRTLPKFLISLGFPSGPVTLSISWPGSNLPRSFVVLPTS